MPFSHSTYMHKQQTTLKENVWYTKVNTFFESLNSNTRVLSLWKKIQPAVIATTMGTENRNLAIALFP